ncbi:hypothetical protein C8J56DRAFT_940213 [Mycena floridula]|nr:hypothetical protein C8J56DRAFT_940213 [Mycena floridula]
MFTTTLFLLFAVFLPCVFSTLLAVAVPDPVNLNEPCTITWTTDGLPSSGSTDSTFFTLILESLNGTEVLNPFQQDAPSTDKEGDFTIPVGILQLGTFHFKAVEDQLTPAIFSNDFTVTADNTVTGRVSTSRTRSSTSDIAASQTQQTSTTSAASLTSSTILRSNPSSSVESQISSAITQSSSTSTNNVPSSTADNGASIPQTTSASSRHVPIGAIIGGILGALVLLGVLVCLALVRRRRQKRFSDLRIAVPFDIQNPVYATTRTPVADIQRPIQPDIESDGKTATSQVTPPESTKRSNTESTATLNPETVELRAEVNMLRAALNVAMTGRQDGQRASWTSTELPPYPTS